MPRKNSTTNRTICVAHKSAVPAHIQLNDTGLTTTTKVVVIAGMCPELTSLEHSPNAFKPDYRVVWACGFLDEDASPSFHRGSEVNFGVFCYERYHCARKVVGRELTLLIICYHLCIRSAEEVCHTVVRKAFVKALCIESYDTRIADDRVIVLEVFRNADMYSKYVDYQHKQQDKLPEHLRMAIDRWRVRRCVSN